MAIRRPHIIDLKGEGLATYKVVDKFWVNSLSSMACLRLYFRGPMFGPLSFLSV